MTGAIIGLLAGAMFGGAAFGGVGALVGGGLGFGLGLVTFMIFSVGHAEVVASAPRKIKCPNTGERYDIKLDPKQARWTGINLKHPRVTECERFEGTPECKRDCEQQIHV